MLNRLCRLEEELFRKRISDSEKAEIFDRLSFTEEAVNKVLFTAKNDNILQEEIAALKRGIDLLRSGLTKLSTTVGSLGADLCAVKKKLTPQLFQQRQKEAETATGNNEKVLKSPFFLSGEKR